MNIETVRALAQILDTHSLTRLETEADGVKIILERNTNATLPQRPYALPESNQAEKLGESLINFNNMTEIKSPVVGVFYSAPSPDSPPFVNIGSAVKKGDVLCIIEAMKVLNEITANCDGEIVDICAKNGDIAEYGQVLFKIV